jgi:hypothetical protein
MMEHKPAASLQGMSWQDARHKMRFLEGGLLRHLDDLIGGESVLETDLEE